MRPSSGRAIGFTLIELLATLAVLAVALLLGAPSLFNMMRRGKLEGTARQMTVLLRQARFESLKVGGLESYEPGQPRFWRARTVVALDLARREVFAFADLNDAAGDPKSDLVFNPDPAAPPRTTDYLIGRFPLPTGVDFGGPAGGGPLDGGAVRGFTPDPRGAGLPPLAVFRSDGSVEATGAFHFGDERQNYLEVLVSPRATARVDVLKWDDGDRVWRTNGEGGKAWTWKV